MRRAIDRLKEPSTWAGLSALAMLAGLTVEQAQAVATAGAAVAGAIAVFMPEGARNARS